MTISNEAIVVALKAWRGTPFGGDALMAALEAAAPIIRAEALEDAAEDAEGMHDPTTPDCQEWAAWLRARAAAERGGQ